MVIHLPTLQCQRAVQANALPTVQTADLSNLLFHPSMKAVDVLELMDSLGYKLVHRPANIVALRQKQVQKLCSYFTPPEAA